MLLLQEVQVQSLVGDLENPYGEWRSKKKKMKEEVGSAWNEEKLSQHQQFNRVQPWCDAGVPATKNSSGHSWGCWEKVHIGLEEGLVQWALLPAWQRDHLC